MPLRRKLYTFPATKVQADQLGRQAGLLGLLSCYSWTVALSRPGSLVAGHQALQKGVRTPECRICAKTHSQRLTIEQKDSSTKSAQASRHTSKKGGQEEHRCLECCCLSPEYRLDWLAYR